MRPINTTQINTTAGQTARIAKMIQDVTTSVTRKRDNFCRQSPPQRQCDWPPFSSPSPWSAVAFAISLPIVRQQAAGVKPPGHAEAELPEKIVAHDPRGFPPKVVGKRLAPRLERLDG